MTGRYVAVAVTAPVVLLACRCTAQHLRLLAPPLVLHDPYFSAWSFGDELTGSRRRHWADMPCALCQLVWADGRPYRIMGREPSAVVSAT